MNVKSVMAGSLKGLSLLKRHSVALGAALVLIGCAAPVEPPSASEASSSGSPSVARPTVPSEVHSPDPTLTADEAAAQEVLLEDFAAMNVLTQDPTEANYGAVLAWVNPLQAESVKNGYDYLVEVGGKTLGVTVVRDIEWSNPREIDGQKFLDVAFCQDGTDEVMLVDGETMAPVFPTLSTSGQLMETRGGWRVVQLVTGPEGMPC